MKVKYEVDSYILEYIEDENKYYISFKDSSNKECRIEINQEIFEAYIKSKKAYVKIKNETSRHIEHSELTEEEIYKRSTDYIESIEDNVIANIEKQEVREAMKTLTPVQYKRVELHIVNEITIRDIAKLENVQKSQIQKSIKLGFKKIKNFLKNKGVQNQD